MRINAKTLPLIASRARTSRVVAFDTETTGGASWDEICQIAAAEYVCGKLTRTLALYVRPTCRVNPWAEAVHGLSDEFLREHGIAPRVAMRQFFDFLGRDALLVAHNIMFDLRMLNQECCKFGLCFDCEGIETCDTLALSRRLRKDLPNHRLATLIAELGIDGVNSHDALDDTLACAGVLFKLIGNLSVAKNETLLPFATEASEGV